jgi:hypothetical protein
MRHSLGVITLLLFSLASSFAYSDTALYGGRGVSPQAVRQGSIGSCYFYASIAALAGTQPDLLRQSILSDENGGLRVRFADGKIEQVHAEDVQFARNSDFDLSEGLWVAVLFRGYAQRTLRAALIDSVNASSLLPPLKSLTSGLIANNDLLLLAYDRAIRSQIRQSGNISRDGLKAQLTKELASVPMLGLWKDRAVEMIDSSGFFESLVAQIEANGELFGAYRAVGHGGLSEEVLSAFAGDAHTYDIKNRDKAAAAISQAMQKHQAVVAWTDDSPLDTLTSKAHSPLDDDAEDWYLRAHAYTVLAVNTTAGTVTMRNPWASHPDPQGEFTLSLDEFVSAYTGFSTSAPGQHRGGE